MVATLHASRRGAQQNFQVVYDLHLDCRGLDPVAVARAKAKQPSRDWKNNPDYVATVARLGRNTRLLREQLGLTLEELAERADLETQQLQKLEVGAIRNPTLVTVFRLAHGLKVPLETLFQRPKKTTG